MTTKRTWRLRSMTGRAAEVMRSAPSLAAAAKALGVNKATVFRWVKAGKIPGPGGRRRAPTVPPSPEGWAPTIRAAYLLDATETALVELADAALTMARDAAMKPADRLAAMARFAQLVRQIDLEVPSGEVATDTGRWPRPVTA